MKTLDAPLPHQLEAITFLHGRVYEQWAVLIHQMRSRKSSTILYFFEQYRMKHDRYAKMLVIAPPKVLPVWEEMKGHFGCGEDVKVLSSGALSGYGDAVRPKYDVVVADELHQFRAYSKRYRTLKKIMEGALFRIGMTGTPIDQRLEEFFYPLTALSDGGFFGTKSREAFRKVYCEKEIPHYDFSPWRLKPEAERELIGELRNVCHTYSGKGTIVPPEHVLVEFDLWPEQKEWIRKIENDIPIDEIKDFQMELKPPHKQDKRRQIESGFLLHNDRAIKRFGTDKWRVLVDILDETEGQVIIWYRYTEEKARVASLLYNRSVGCFCPKNFKAFREGKLRIIIAHPRAAGAGLDFSCADAAIFLTHNPSQCDTGQASFRLCIMNDTVDRKKKSCFHLSSSTAQGRKDFERFKEKIRITERLYESTGHQVQEERKDKD